MDFAGQVRKSWRDSARHFLPQQKNPVTQQSVRHGLAGAPVGVLASSGLASETTVSLAEIAGPSEMIMSLEDGTGGVWLGAGGMLVAQTLAGFLQHPL